MRQIQTRHLLLFRILRDHCLFLTRRQIQRIFTLAIRSANKELVWLLSKRYLQRKYRVDTISHFQVPVYYLGEAGWSAVGKASERYKAYRADIERRSDRNVEHLLSVYDVLLKFLLETSVKRIIDGEDKFWRESFDFGNIPDAWIQFSGGEAFIEVDRGTERPIVVAEKLAKYVKFKESGIYKLIFRGCGFRVLFVTTNEQRIETLAPLAKTDDIWFATKDEFLREKLGLQHWFAVNGFYALPIAAEKEVQQLR